MNCTSCNRLVLKALLQLPKTRVNIMLIRHTITTLYSKHRSLTLIKARQLTVKGNRQSVPTLTSRISTLMRPLNGLLWINSIVHVSHVILMLGIIRLVLHLFSLITRNMNALQRLLANKRQHSRVTIIGKVSSLASLILIAMKRSNLVRAIRPNVRLVVN